MQLHCPQCNQVQSCRSVNNQPRSKHKTMNLDNGVSVVKVNHALRNRRCTFCDHIFSSVEFPYTELLQIRQSIKALMDRVQIGKRDLELTQLTHTRHVDHLLNLLDKQDQEDNSGS